MTRPDPAVQFDVQGLCVAYPDFTRKRLFGRAPMVEVLHDVHLQIGRGESIGIVGESGSGKSTLARALLRLVPSSGGAILLDGTDITNLTESELRPLRRKMQIVFQDSQSSLNPRFTVSEIVAEPLISQGLAISSAIARRRAAELLDLVGLAPEYRARYAHQLSGGQRQRVGIARALALEPEVIVADEIVSGLDVSVQAQILQLLDQLRRQRKLTLVLISHDLSVVRATCERVVVMRSGHIVESGTSAEVFARPQERYTQALLRAIPLPDVDPEWIFRVQLDEPGRAAPPGP